MIAGARSVAGQITSFSYCAAYAFGQANVLIVGWNIGEKKQKACYRITYFASILAIGVGVVLEILFASFSPWIGQVFTQDQTLLTAVRIVLFIDIALEVGRAGNLVYGNALKASGDAFFPMIVNVVATLITVIGGTYLFAVTCRLGAIGAYIALAADECTRGIFVFFRFRSGKWEKKALVKDQTSKNIQASDEGK